MSPTLSGSDVSMADGVRRRPAERSCHRHDAGRTLKRIAKRLNAEGVASEGRTMVIEAFDRSIVRLREDKRV